MSVKNAIKLLEAHTHVISRNHVYRIACEYRAIPEAIYVKVLAELQLEANKVLVELQEKAKPTEFTKVLRQQIVVYESIDLAPWVTQKEAELIRNTLNKIPNACDIIDQQAEEITRQKRQILDLADQLRSANGIIFQLEAKNETWSSLK